MSSDNKKEQQPDVQREERKMELEKQSDEQREKRKPTEEHSINQPKRRRVTQQAHNNDTKPASNHSSPRDQKTVACAPAQFFTRPSRLLTDKLIDATPLPRDLAHIVTGYTIEHWLTLSAEQRKAREEKLDFSHCDFSDMTRDELDPLLELCKKSKHSPNFQGALLGNIDFSFVELPKANFREAYLAGIMMTGAVLIEAEFHGADLTKACITGGSFHKAILSDAILVQAKAWGADFSGAILIRANYTEADLMGAKLIGANLSKANLTKANCINADFSQAILTKTVLTEADLRQISLVDPDAPCEDEPQPEGFQMSSSSF